ncbi:short-chain fatty acyl-CoA regulator family protein [Jannaschia sp. LMIT008]|uniref:short-chain fatty acyl-CoA regulator family protein n=1 Tax=Jannaschia maritima TaxID=3032585 RepID=UPI002811D8F0|nr:short-chain fatty acyl-CoA regulator family protein [Jannaschia sp. LMIT008]
MGERATPTGARIRERRLTLGLRQGQTAAAAGISPSYLNLIEHDRRPVAGALLGRLAEVLGVDRAQLLGDGEPELLDALRVAARQSGLGDGVVGDAPELVRRFPDWARLVAELVGRAERDRARIAALSDRLANDPALADAMHEILSTVSSVRATASILAQSPTLDAAWLRRFHDNLDVESRRLARAAEGMTGFFDAQGERAEHGTPAEVAQAFLSARPRPEPGGAPADVRALVADLPPDARGLASAALERDRADAAALPRPDPAAIPADLAAAAGVPVPLVLRRIAALDPARGLVVCDAAGAVLRRRDVAGFVLPSAGSGCALWPVHAAFARPMHPIRTYLATPDDAVWIADAAVEVAAGTTHGPVLEATMMVTRAAGRADATPLPVGPGCRVCPRTGCPARREPSLTGAGQDGAGG